MGVHTEPQYLAVDGVHPRVASVSFWQARDVVIIVTIGCRTTWKPAPQGMGPQWPARVPARDVYRILVVVGSYDELEIAIHNSGALGTTDVRPGCVPLRNVRLVLEVWIL